MRYRFIPTTFAAALGVLLALVPAGAADAAMELSVLRQRTIEQAALLQKQQALIDGLLKRTEELEARLDARLQDRSGDNLTVESGAYDREQRKQAGQQRVDLSTDDSAAAPERAEHHVLASPWYENIRIDGFGGAGYVRTGDDATNAKGNFLNYEATINVEAEVWEDVDYFHELRTVRLADEKTKFVRTGEVYLHMKDPLSTLFGIAGTGVGAKLGRMDIPFGEDYLTQDVIDNPLITLSAAYPYGLDEGLVLYGHLKGLNWVAALMDGDEARASEDTGDKFVSLKLYGNVSERLYLSASVFDTGDTATSAFEYGGTHLSPVGSDNFPSIVGVSGSSTVDSRSVELDLRYTLGPDRYVKLQWGSVWIDDKDPFFDRKLYYAQVEPKWNLGSRFANKVYVVARASAIGTFDDDEGYGFDGKPFADGKAAFGFDTKALYRWAIGLGYWANPRLLMKLEYSRDDFQTIDGSPTSNTSEDRDLIGAVMAVRF